MKGAFDRFWKVVRAHNLKWLRRVVVGVIGGTVLLIGIALIVLPGPAVLVIPLGLAILATEFVWAGRLLGKARQLFKKEKAPPDSNSSLTRTHSRRR